MGSRVEAALTGSWASVFTRFAPSQAPGWLVDRLAVVGLLLAIVVGVAALRRPVDRLTFALLLPAVLWVPFHVKSYLPSDAPASRYGLPLLPFLAVWLAHRVRSFDRGLVLVWVFTVFSSLGLIQATHGLSGRGHVLHNRTYALLAHDLQRHGRTAVFADYWIAYRLAAETNERITADPPSQSRYRPYAEAARTAPRTTVVVFEGQANDKKLRTQWAGVERVVLGPFAIYYAPGRLSPPGFDGTFDVDPP